VALQSDGKILVSGTVSGGSICDFALVRYNTDGSLDASFGNLGRVITPIGSGDDAMRHLVLQADGKIVVSGVTYNASGSDFALVRYHGEDGRLDTSFNGTGKVITSIGPSYDSAGVVALQSDGKLVVAGDTSNGGQSDFAVVRYVTNGSLDTSFGGTGKIVTNLGGNEQVTNLAVQADGKIIVVGISRKAANTSEIAIVRYLADGSLDLAFNGTGTVFTQIGVLDAPTGVAVQPDGKLVVGGFSSHTEDASSAFVLVRYHPNGSLDLSFGAAGTGKVITSIGSFSVCSSIALQSDGKIVAAGHSVDRFALARYLADGNLDTTFNGTGIVTTSIGTSWGSQVALQNDGRIVLAGTAQIGTKYVLVVARYEGGPFTPYEQWKVAQLGNVNAPDTSNSDGDAYVNLTEYGLVLGPTEYSAGPAGGRFAYADGERLRMIFTRDPARNDVTIEAEAADDMAGPWTVVASSVFGAPMSGAGYVGGDSAGAGLKTVEVRDVFNVGDPAHPRRYLRLRVRR